MMTAATWIGFLLTLGASLYLFVGGLLGWYAVAGLSGSWWRTWFPFVPLIAAGAAMFPLACHLAPFTINVQ